MSNEITFIQIDGDSDDPFGPCWGVLDPQSEPYRHYMQCIGTDILPMVDAIPRRVGDDGLPRRGFLVDHRKFTTDQLTLLCKYISRLSKEMTELDVFFYITRGAGILIAVQSIHLCPDPEMGRAWWRRIAEAKAKQTSEDHR